MNKVQLDLECKYELEESSVENPEFLKILENDDNNPSGQSTV
jgi:hypothetical protein